MTADFDYGVEGGQNEAELGYNSDVEVVGDAGYMADSGTGDEIPPTVPFTQSEDEDDVLGTEESPILIE